KVSSNNNRTKLVHVSHRFESDQKKPEYGNQEIHENSDQETPEYSDQALQESTNKTSSSVVSDVNLEANTDQKNK
ncbi:6579_t:CDS:2, partial [Gigaspora margarita]